MSLFAELKRRNVFKVAIACMHEQDGPSLGRLHLAAQTRGSAPLARSPAARVGTHGLRRSIGASFAARKPRQLRRLAYGVSGSLSHAQRLHARQLSNGASFGFAENRTILKNLCWLITDLRSFHYAGYRLRFRREGRPERPHVRPNGSEYGREAVRPCSPYTACASLCQGGVS